MMVSRVGEVAWGVAVATATVWAISRIGRQNPAGQIE
jgi:hypothetical protein